jgi:DNA-binding NarL/FixJ family response regulator
VAEPIVNPVPVRLTCLIVDDNIGFLTAATALLEREGLEVVGVARQVTDAVRLETELQPDVVLVDVDLGAEDGFDLAEQLESNVILVSTHAEEDLGQLVEASRALGFVPKARLSADAIRDLVDSA